MCSCSQYVARVTTARNEKGDRRPQSREWYKAQSDFLARYFRAQQIAHLLASRAPLLVSYTHCAPTATDCQAHPHRRKRGANSARWRCKCRPSPVITANDGSMSAVWFVCAWASVLTEPGVLDVAGMVVDAAGLLARWGRKCRRPSFKRSSGLDDSEFSKFASHFFDLRISILMTAHVPNTRTQIKDGQNHAGLVGATDITSSTASMSDRHLLHRTATISSW